MTNSKNFKIRPVFCGNFEYDTCQSELERMFSRYGRVERVDMKSDEEVWARWLRQMWLSFFSVDCWLRQNSWRLKNSDSSSQGTIPIFLWFMTVRIFRLAWGLSQLVPHFVFNLWTVWTRLRQIRNGGYLCGDNLYNFCYYINSPKLDNCTPVPNSFRGRWQSELNPGWRKNTVRFLILVWGSSQLINWLSLTVWKVTIFGDFTSIYIVQVLTVLEVIYKCTCSPNFACLIEISVVITTFFWW